MNSWVVALRRISWIAAGVSVITVGLLAANAVQVRRSDPAPPTTLEHLVARLDVQRDDNTLKQELHKQDQWLRVTHVRSQRFSETGFFVLLGSVSAFLLCSKWVRRLSDPGPMPNPKAPVLQAAQAEGAQRGVFSLGILGAGALAFLAVASRHDSLVAYVESARMPTPAAGTPSTSASQGEALAVLAPPAASSPAGAAPPVTGAIPSPLPGAVPGLAPAPVTGGTNLVPLPSVTPGSAPVKAVTPIKVSVVPAPVGAWPMFRGTAAVLSGPAPANWDGPSGKGILWKSEVPLSAWNSPVVFGGQVYLSGATIKERAVYAYSAKDGKRVWSAAIPMTKQSAPMTGSADAGFAPSTMAVDAKGVYAAFVNGDIVALSHEGKMKWTLSLGKMDNNYGYASSLAVADGHLLVLADQGGSPTPSKSKLIALDPATGKALWATSRAVSASWSTPLPIGQAVIVAGSPYVAAYDLRTGKEMWKADGLSGEVAPSPSFFEGRIYVAQMGSQAMAINAADGKTLWASSDAALPDVSSPTAADGFVILSAADGTLTALNAVDGAIVWEHRLPKPARATPLVVGRRIYVLSTDGVMRILTLGKVYKEEAVCALGEEASASPSLVDGRLYIRGAKHLFCIGGPQ